MTKIIAYKGFNSDWTCRDFQYEVGKTYEHEGKVEACSSGLHSCENPMDVWSYYDIINADGELNKFAKVTASGELARHDEDSKIASAKITIEAELTIPEFIKSSVDWLMGLAKCDDVEAASGDYSKLAASGDYSQLAASGYSSKLAASGEDGVISSSGPNSRAKGAEGTWISIAEFDDNGKCIGFATGCIGKGGLEPDTWYRASGLKLEKIE